MSEPSTPSSPGGSVVGKLGAAGDVINLTDGVVRDLIGGDGFVAPVIDGLGVGDALNNVPDLNPGTGSVVDYVEQNAGHTAAAGASILLAPVELIETVAVGGFQFGRWLHVQLWGEYDPLQDPDYLYWMAHQPTIDPSQIDPSLVPVLRPAPLEAIIAP